MQIVLKHATADDVWNQITDNHYMYHKKLKHFAYNFDNFVPKDARIREMFEIENLTDAQLKQYRDIFINEIYNENDLNKFDDVIVNQVIPMMHRGVEKLKPLLKSWGATVPDELEIVCHYGNGGAYKWGNINRIMFRCSESKRNHFGIAQLFMHEFIHILIEKPIIQKHHVPQDLKERIVDIIGFEFFGKPVQPRYEKSFANKYITIEAVKNDLPGAVAKMMADYTAIQRQNGNEKK